jgi:hypothetical protein
MHLMYIALSLFIIPAMAQFKLDPFKGVNSTKIALLSAEEIARANNEWMRSCDPKDVAFCCWTKGNILLKIIPIRNSVLELTLQRPFV